LRPLAEEYWFEARSMRELTKLHKQSLHRIRQQLAIVKSWLIVLMSADRPLQ
jgi:hypothetical protein